MFTDFGDEHIVTDADGEPSRALVVDNFEDGLKITVAAKRHGFDDGDLVELEDLECNENEVKPDTLPVSKLNGLKNIKVKRIYFKYDYKRDDGKIEKRTKQMFNKLTLDLSETEYKDKSFSGWKTGGIVNERKKRKALKFRSFEDALRIPAVSGLAAFYGPQHPDQGEWEKGGGKTVHLCLQSVLTFYDAKKRFPKLHDEDDQRFFMKVFKQLNKANKDALAEQDKRNAAIAKAKQENKEYDAGDNEDLTGITVVDRIDKKRVNTYALYFEAELTGYCAFLGGVAAQEIVKKFGKFTPIHQWLHTDHLMLVGESVPSDAIPQNSRYDHQITIFGKSFQKLISNQKIFLVGCGALGCEYLKGLALMGVGSGPNGKIWCTDMDRIEVSNLSRQFLFRAKHVGKQKSTTAANSAKEMNPAFNVEPLEMKVWPETENFFDDDFWDNLDLCWNALDNVKARQYTDSKCLLHSKPLLESGTQGTKCNSDVIIPYKTKSYNDGEETEAEGIPMCTLQNFPYLPVHCIEWARSAFANFENIPQVFNTFKENSNKFFEQVDNASGKEKIKMLQDCVKLCTAQLTGGVTFKTCIQLAFDEYYEQHIKRIKDLVTLFPENEVVKDDNGVEIGKFWTGHKRFPAVPKYDINNDKIVNYLYCASNLWAFIFGIPYVRDIPKFKDELNASGVKEPKYVPPSADAKKGIQTDENADEKKGDNDDALDNATEQLIDDLIAKLKQIDINKLKLLNVHDFEKDDDTNFHIDFITACANARARNYRIKEQSRHECKITAGRIIAALATTTAMICGLVELEFYKLKLGLQYINQDKFYNANINLAVAQFQYFQPDNAITHEEREEKDEAYNEIVKIKPYPNKWTTWDNLVINKGNLTCEEFGNIFPKLFNGIKCKIIFKKDAKQGGLICDFERKPRNTKMQDTMLKRDNLSDNLRDKFQKQKDDILLQNKQIDVIRQQKVIDRYLKLYCEDRNGKLVSDKRNYILLDGDFEYSDGTSAELPVIRYFFK